MEKRSRKALRSTGSNIPCVDTAQGHHPDSPKVSSDIHKVFKRQLKDTGLFVCRPLEILRCWTVTWASGHCSLPLARRERWPTCPCFSFWENKTVWKMHLSFKSGGTTHFSTCSRGSEEQSTVHLKDPLGVLVPLTPAPGSTRVDAIWGQRPHSSKSRPVEVMLLSSTLAQGKTSSSAHLPLTNHGLP